MVAVSPQSIADFSHREGAAVIDRVIRQFVEHVGHEPGAVAYAPGRVTVIGGHTDYNGGLAVSAALPFGTAVAIGRSGKPFSRLISDQQPLPVQLQVGELAERPEAFWTRYVIGSLFELGYVSEGFNVSVSSSLPMRRGLASSAALIVASVRAALQLRNRQRAAPDLVSLCQRVEQVYAGVRCGLLDPYTALHAQGSSDLLLIDCASSSHIRMALPSDLALVVCDSGASRQLARSHYNLRRTECHQIAALLGRLTLRGASVAELHPWRGICPAATRRAEHVIGEIDRVRQFWKAMNDQDYASTKALMAAAHQSGRDLFECSHPAVDALVELANRSPGCVGARFTGAGWGGATVNLVLREYLPAFHEAVDKRACDRHRERALLPLPTA